MKVFPHPVGGGGGAGCGGGSVAVANRPFGRQQMHLEVDYGAVASQRLLEAVQRGDPQAAAECLADPAVDVNYAGTVCVRTRRIVVELREEAADEVRVEYEELRTDASALFLASHAGDVPLVRKLLANGADVNQKLFGGHAITAAAREGWPEVVELLLKAGASQPACEEAVVEASLHGRPRLVELLMSSDLVRPRVAVHALVSVASRGYVDVVDSLIKCGVDANATSRLLLRSLKPSLHTNVNCTPLFAAIIGRQVAIVRCLLQAGARMDAKARLGSWAWDSITGEELRVGVGLAEAYDAAWCAVEYFESTGAILRMFLPQNSSLEAPHNGRTLLHHAILCGNPGAVHTLLARGADRERLIKAHRKTIEFRPLHLAARLGRATVLRVLVDDGCDLNSRSETGETALMLCAQYRRDECLRILVSAGADLGLLSLHGDSAISAAASSNWSDAFARAVLDVIRLGAALRSSSRSVFSAITFAARHGDVGALEVLLKQPEIDINELDDNGDSPVMAVAKECHVDAFRFLVFAGADMTLRNKAGDTMMEILRTNENRYLLKQVMLEFALERGNSFGFHALHFAVLQGNVAATHVLTKQREFNVNALDSDGYTPLMLAAREGHAEICELLIHCGAKCDVNTRLGETALSLARGNAKLAKEAEEVILDEVARVLVVRGGRVKKHTRCGKGPPHRKVLKMVAFAGVLSWGNSRRRNVVCREAMVGGSMEFAGNRKAKGDASESGLFRVLTTSNREVHFVCEGGDEAAELWVRGIRLLTTAAFGNTGKKRGKFTFEGDVLER